MCTPGCLDFVDRRLGREDLVERTVLEVGSRDFNGSVRALVMRYHPSRYVGVDRFAGPGVDQICRAEGVLDRFGPDSFDVVVTTEMLEHVRDWRNVVHNLKSVAKPGGLLVLTTRSRGTAFHGYPHDYWRYDVPDMQAIFSDLAIEALEKDPALPGVMMRARKPTPFIEKTMEGYPLYSIIKGRSTSTFGPVDYMLFRIRLAGREWLSSPRLSGLKTILKRYVRPRGYP